MIHFLQVNSDKVSVRFCDDFLVFRHIYIEARDFKKQTYKRHPL